MSDSLRSFSLAARFPLSRFRRSAPSDETVAIGPRGRLFRKYVLLIVGLVSLVLLLNSALDFWFSYEENKEALFRIQQEKAGSAARRIEQFIDEIERQLGWTTAPQWAASPLEQRRFDYVRLLRQAPAITELIQLDDTGKEQLKVSRLAIDVVGSEKDYSQSPSFIEARQHRVWFSPVYFRKESEPYMTVALARTGRNAGVTVAEVNLKLIWDVITGLKTGQGGYAYVVDRDGRLIAHPDISLVLRNTDLSNLPQVAAALAGAPFLPSPAGGGGLGWGQPIDRAVMVAQGISGNSVLTAHAGIAPLGWTVFVELPLNEALAPLYGSMLRTAALLVLALVLATLAALLLARRMTVPIRELQAGAARIGAGELDRHIEIQTGDELEDLAGDFNRMASDLQKSYANLEKKVEDRTAELKEALEQQTATAEVLGVINSSPGDLTPVFDAMLEKALTLCEAVCGQLATYDGEAFEFVALKGDARWLDQRPHGRLPASRGLTWSRLVAGEPFVHILDALDTEAYRSGHEGARDAVIAGGRTFLTVALRREQALLGALTVYRQEVRPFSDKQIALLQNFAAQAVIAMENARLLTETREALEQQTATAEVLQVINSSPGDLAPVFDAILEKAHTLCGAAHGGLNIYDGDRFRNVAAHAIPPRFAELMRQPFHARPIQQRLLRGERCVHVPDMMTSTREDPNDPIGRASDEAGIRTLLVVPLRKDSVLLGYITAHREEVRPFSDKQIALLENFAAQAVIAMENARLITETREALEQQTATAEVLQVINSTPGDLTPVFDAMLERAMRLCEADVGNFWTYDGEAFTAVAMRDPRPEHVEWARQRRRGGPGSISDGLIRGESVIHIPDAADTDAYRAGEPARRAIVDLNGGRTLLAVALRKGEELLGYITIFRRVVRPFSDKQIALLQNFAAQAVIAMENARLLTETREALEQQTATAEVLQVINSSPGDLAPVFEAIVEKAHGLCDAACGSLQLWDGEKFRGVAMRGFSEAMAEGLRQGYIPGPNHPCRRLLEGERIAHCADLAEIDDPVTRAGGVAQGGIRTILFVALRKDDVLLGQIVAARQEVRPFSENEIALVENFAAQAVIAMENARLITETREALEQQTATAEVLQVINSSPGDLHPVFDAMLEKAMALSGASFGGLSTYDGDQFLAVATHGVPAALKGFFRNPYTVSPQSYFGQLVGGKTLLHVADLAAESPLGTAPLSRAGVERGRAFVDLGKARTGLFLALRKEDALLGILWFYRQEVRPFSEKQIALLQNFAAQAVIAMENARLITETREALEQQTATAEVLQVINSSPGDLAPVFDAILEKAHTLCGAAHGSLQLYDGENLHAVATNAVSFEFADILRQGYRAADSPASQALIEGKPFAHIADCAEIDHPVFRSAAELAGIHTVLFVPLSKDGAFLGLISAARLEVRPFSEKEIALLQNFAAQAVIAMENARLITETREALEQQTATAEVLQVINSSPGDLAPVFDAMLEKALRLCDAAFGVLWTGEGESYRAAALRGVPPAYAEFVTREQRGRQPGGAPGRLCGGEPLVHIPDTSASTPDEMGRTLDELGGIRTLLAVPLRKEDAVLGAFTIYRPEVRPFSDKQIALLQNFAAQAVIAMENARLITETHEALEQQTATAEVLQVINGSPGDLAPVFDAMLEKAVRLCDAKFGILFSYHGEHFRPTAFRGVPTAYADYLNQAPLRPGPQTALGRVVRGESLIAVSDSADDDAYRSGDPLRRARVELGGARSAVTCALRKDDALLGVFTIYRQEVLPFSAKQIALLENFAAQAVIAMENARLITELRQRTHDLQE
ncbi:MAG TPA: GAF domain-containing protein, partial [Stellaceae bacterium]|nr:GAF domain-containing protein [Stellaceae bacterium]